MYIKTKEFGIAWIKASVVATLIASITSGGFFFLAIVGESDPMLIAGTIVFSLVVGLVMGRSLAYFYNQKVGAPYQFDPSALMKSFGLGFGIVGSGLLQFFVDSHYYRLLLGLGWMSTVAIFLLAVTIVPVVYNLLSKRSPIFVKNFAVSLGVWTMLLMWQGIIRTAGSNLGELAAMLSWVFVPLGGFVIAKLYNMGEIDGSKIVPQSSNSLN
jgi:hypothetical protein